MIITARAIGSPASSPGWQKPYPPDAYRDLLPEAKAPENYKGMIVGVGVVGIHKDRDGNWPDRGLIYRAWVRLTVLGIDANTSRIDVQGATTEELYWIVDDSRTQIWQYDQNSVYVPFENLQRNLGMDAREEKDPDTGKVTKVPARTRELQVAAKPGVDLQTLKAKVQQVVDEVVAQIEGRPESHTRQP